MYNEVMLMNNNKRKECPYPREHLEWRPLPGYEKQFEISNYGDAHILEYDFTDTRGAKHHRDERFIWSENQKKFGGSKTKYNNQKYYQLHLPSMNSEFAHRLAALTFIPNPLNKEQVNHKDGNGHNNYCGCKENNYEDSNLEWVTRLENCQHASRTGLINRTSEKRKEAAKRNREKIDYDNIKRPVIQLTLDGQYIAEYPSIVDAAKAINKGTTIIGSVLQHNSVHKSAGGFNWIYKDEYDPNKDNSVFITPPGVSGSKAVIQYDLEGNKIKEYRSLSEASISLIGTPYGSQYIRQCALGIRAKYLNYTWKFVS